MRIYNIYAHILFHSQPSICSFWCCIRSGRKYQFLRKLELAKLLNKFLCFKSRMTFKFLCFESTVTFNPHIFFGNSILADVLPVVVVQ